jgi:gamma-glutamylputrescine oxidase
MKYKDFSPQDNVFWYLKRKALQPLRQSIQADVVVVGGGMAGLSAAQSFHEKGKSVVLLEQYYCGGGASGKSSGFITPNSELGLHNLVRELGPMAAKKLWEFVKSGVSHIEDNIKKFNMVCDDEILDTCIVANSKKKFKEIEIEHEAFKKFAYDSHLYQQAGVRGIIGSDTYFGAQVYDSTFGIDAYLYCQGMKDILQKQGVQIYEETPVINVGQSGVETTHAQVRADHIVICVDRFLPQFETSLGKKVSHVPTFIMVSEPLTDHDIKKIFPQKNMLVWDTDMIYQYFRIIQNQRFLIGGSEI